MEGNLIRIRPVPFQALQYIPFSGRNKEKKQIHFFGRWIFLPENWFFQQFFLEICNRSRNGRSTYQEYIMGFSGATDITVYKFADTKKLNQDKVRKFAFVGIDDTPYEESAQGWTNIDDIMDTEWNLSPLMKGEWLCFAYRKDKRSVPAAVLKKHLALKMAEYKNQGVSVKKKDIKDEVKNQLLAKTEPTPASVDIAISLQNGLALVATSSKGTLEAIEGLLGDTFHAEFTKLTNENSPSDLFVEIFRDGLHVDTEDGAFTILYGSQLTMIGKGVEDAPLITVKNDQATVEKGLESELVIQKIKVQVEDPNGSIYECTLSDDEGQIGIKGAKIPVQEEKTEENDRDELFVFRLGLFETLVGVIRTAFAMK